MYKFHNINHNGAPLRHHGIEILAQILVSKTSFRSIRYVRSVFCVHIQFRPHQKIKNQ